MLAITPKVMTAVVLNLRMSDTPIDGGPRLVRVNTPNNADSLAY
jgi:hypothetical protein